MAFTIPSMVFRGLYDAEREYGTGDVVASNGSGWVALRDATNIDPGTSDAWALIAKQGRVGRQGERGEQGLRGAQGDRGAPAASIAHMSVEDSTLVVEMSDGEIKTVPLPEIEALKSRVASMEAWLGRAYAERTVS
jgi:hypothetical protein